MEPMVSAGGATALALALLFCATAPAIAHEDHKKKTQEAASEQPVVEEATPLPTAVVSAEQKPHDHANHGHEADAAADSAHEEALESGVPKPLAWLGKFHPPVTHFPIALLTAAAIAELLFMRTGAIAYRHALLFCARIGAGTALLAAVLGWFFAGFRLIDKECVMTAHRWAGTSVALFSVWLLYLAEQIVADEPTTATARFRTALFAAAGLVGATGFLGGALLYGLDHYAW
jgi:uncharacterized membrane protein